MPVLGWRWQTLTTVNGQAAFHAQRHADRKVLRCHRRLDPHLYCQMFPSLQIILYTLHEYCVLRRRRWRCGRMFRWNTQLPWRSHDMSKSTGNVYLPVSIWLSYRQARDDLWRYMPRLYLIFYKLYEIRGMSWYNTTVNKSYKKVTNWIWFMYSDAFFDILNFC